MVTEELLKGQSYEITYSGSFVGTFDRIEVQDGEQFAVFVQEGRTDRGSIPLRTFLVSRILNAKRV